MKKEKKTPPQSLPDRYKLRIDTDVTVKEALIKEQGKRQGDTHKRVSVKEIIAEWLEEKAGTVLGSH
jgi:hypothetical protein